MFLYVSNLGCRSCTRVKFYFLIPFLIPCLAVLVAQDHVGISNAASPDAPLIPLSIPHTEGEREEANTDVRSCIHDHICNLQFRLSPTAFFQVV